MAEQNYQQPYYPSDRYASRAEWLASDEFDKLLTEHFKQAASAAIQDHFAKGLPVHAYVDGKLTKILLSASIEKKIEE